MNFKFSNTALGRFRLVAISEGFSYLLLLFIAMPLKYMAGWSEGVTYVGWVHGLLFMLYILALVTVKFTLNWGVKKTIIAFLASLIPFATFILDKSLQKEEKLIEEEKLVS
jgi:integral membrane protein